LQCNPFYIVDIYRADDEAGENFFRSVRCDRIVTRERIIVSNNSRNSFFHLDLCGFHAYRKKWRACNFPFDNLFCKVLMKTLSLLCARPD